LAEDIGQALGVGAHLSSLKRVGVGELDIANAMTLEELEAVPESERENVLMPLDALLQNCPALHLAQTEAKRFIQGQRLKTDMADAQMVRVYWSNGGNESLIGLAGVSKNTLSPQKVLMTALPEQKGGL
jgi:tRNA pseudouridine55 synthase